MHFRTTPILLLLAVILTTLPIAALPEIITSYSLYAHPLHAWILPDKRPPPPPPPPTSGCGFPLSPICVRTAYGFTGVSADGSGVTIAIVDAFGDPSLLTDLSNFDGKYGLSAPSLTVIGSSPRRNSGWALETALDVEWAHAIAPGAAIRLYIGADNSFANLLNAINSAITDNKATVISMSFGADEGSFSSSGFLSSYESAFSQAVSEGITPVAASGDTGGVVIYPSSSTSVVAVGGTTLTLDSSTGAYISESAWSSSGGGSSTLFSEPSYQLGVPAITNNQRGTPDVAYDADPATGFDVFCSFCGGEFQVGGTSAGAPQWAALVALTVQTHSGARLGLANNPIYTIGKGSTYATNFHDITTGTSGSFTAGTGWDFTTGWGSPQANTLVPSL